MCFPTVCISISGDYIYGGVTHKVTYVNKSWQITPYIFVHKYSYVGMY